MRNALNKLHKEKMKSILKVLKKKKMEGATFIAETMDDKAILIKIRNITDIAFNWIDVTSEYDYWLKTGKGEKYEYELTPECLRRLIWLVEHLGLDEIIDFRIHQSKYFLEQYPTRELLQKYYDEYDALPTDEVNFVKHRNKK